MINDLVAKRLAAHIAATMMNGGPVTRVAGLSVMVEQLKPPSNRPIRYAVAADPETDVCSGEPLHNYLIPDDKQALLIYFEDQRTERVGKKWICSLRLVAWGNLRRLQSSGPPSEIKTELLLFVERGLRAATFPPDSLLLSVEIERMSVPPTGTNLFSAYTYRDTHANYLMHPFFAFALDIQLTAILRNDCYPVSITTAYDGTC